MKDNTIAVVAKYINPVKKIPGIETIIVDNSPPNKNVGFAKGVNVGIKKAISQGAKKILLLNPDIKINKKQILQLAKNNADIVSPVLKSNGVCDYGGRVNWVLGRTTHNEMLKQVQHDMHDTEMDYVSGACMMIDKKVFEKIGFFDERFFMYFEDVDFCLRAQHTGFAVGVNPKVIVEHDLETVSETKNKTKMNYAWKSNLEFVKKWVPWYFKPIAYIYLLWLWTRTLAFARDAETLLRPGRASSA